MVPLIPNTFLGFLLCIREQNSIYSFYLSLRLTLIMALGRLLTLAELLSFIQQVSIEYILCVKNCFQHRG